MANNQNLQPAKYHLTQEEAKRGGKKSGESRRKKRLLKNLIDLLGSKQVVDEDVRQRMRELGVDDEDIINDMAIVAALYWKALKGDVAAFSAIRDTKGEKPHEVVETPNIEYKPLVDLTKRRKNGEGNEQTMGIRKPNRLLRIAKEMEDGSDDST